VKITHPAQLDDIPNPHGVSARKLLDTPNAQVIQITLLPGQSLKRHVTPVDVFFYVLEGKGTVQIGDQQASVGPDVLVESPAGIPHRLINEGETPFRFLVVKVPRPTEKTRLV